jgi:TDG/mug DNA glycosylase family protein
MTIGSKITKQDLLKAKDKTVPDIIDCNLKVLFCGINPGLYTAAAGHHFARPGNRFWKALYESGFTNRLFSPYEDLQLLDLQLGITNLVKRASNAASEVTEGEFQEGGKILISKVKTYRPEWVAFIGLGAYQKAFAKKKAKIGLQPVTLEKAKVWVLPSTSGLNANYKPDDLIQLFTEFKKNIYQ